MPETTGSKQDGRFQTGQSGNPAGRPKGARHQVTLLAEKLMQDDAKAIVKTVIDSAKAGDLQAAKIVLDRIMPARRDSPISFELPKIENTGDAVAAQTAILSAVSNGDITPSEATEVSKLIDGFVKTLEVRDLEERIKALEQKV